MSAAAKRIYKEIIANVARIYEGYEQRASQMNQQKRKKTGGVIDKQEKAFLDNLNRLEPNMEKLFQSMTSSKLKGKDRDNIGIFKKCLTDVRAFKKKQLMFKPNQQLTTLMEQTTNYVNDLTKNLKLADDTGFLCCGGDGYKRLMSFFEAFKMITPKWEILTSLEPKDSVENFVSPKFSERDYTFIQKILDDNWEQPKVHQVIKEVPKYINTGQPSILANANEFIYGINRQPNPLYGLRLYKKEADQNRNAAAAAFLAKVYQEGELLAKNIPQSIKYYRQAMEKEDNYAIYCYSRGLIKGLYNKGGQKKQDIQHAYKLLENLISRPEPYPYALVQLADIYQHGHFEDDYHKLFTIQPIPKKAIELYQKAAKMNVVRAFNNLGVLCINQSLKYQNSDTQNQDRISMNLEKARDKGYKQAFYVNQENEAQNYERGLKYLETAKDMGYGQAFYNLGTIYSKGLLQYKAQDSQKALYLFYQGATKEDNKCKIKFAYELMKLTTVWKDKFQTHYLLALLWLQSALRHLIAKEENEPTNLQISQMEKGECLFGMGLFYEFGFGVQISKKKAFSYYLQASELQYPKAKNKLGDCYFSGYGVKKNEKIALGLYKQAADLKDADAMTNLGTIFLNGFKDEIDADYEKAFDYLRRAAFQHENTDAMIHLSYMFKNGLGTPQDYETAYKLLDTAAEKKNSKAIAILQHRDRSAFSCEPDIFSMPKKINIYQKMPLISNL